VPGEVRRDPNESLELFGARRLGQKAGMQVEGRIDRVVFRIRGVDQRGNIRFYISRLAEHEGPWAVAKAQVENEAGPLLGGASQSFAEAPDSCGVRSAAPNQ
jgi:hypothetical protein